MLEKLTAFTESLSRIPAALLVALIATISIILFVPESIANTLSIDGFREQFRVYLGPSLLLLIAIACVRLAQLPINIWKAKKLLAQRQETLHNLTSQEKGYPSKYIFDDHNTINVGLNDGVMAGLEYKRIVYRASNTGTVENGFPFNLHDWAREYLKQNSHLLEGAIGSPRTPDEILRDDGW
ncbi:super-infection exclusion protein B [Gimesia panareensis]|uniref:Superinfection exclusion protein B n=1 Tax=Gimesia panareensis TaxID=2527978 RepID=A0A517QCP3_9PLAN|nr:super-infection exclusion protein B [Gimesia panareensis]QDT29393.1 hypothetical protein Enr10x_47460 [Gimesia panareensis]QDU52434.1 hypothetical protein Pan110_48120 [Gimesia panareensis]QDV20212.1 hypothetical protein Pan153_48850 [Gimesia panareensis]